MPLLERYRALVAEKALKPDAGQLAAAQKLDTLARALKSYKPGGWWPFGKRERPRGLYIWGDVGGGNPC
jgi:cell division protein ZapE